MLQVVVLIMLLALLLAFLRFLKGPDNSDRVVALDVLSTQGAGLLVVVSLLFDNAMLLDVSLVFALVGFVGVIVYSRYLEGRF